MAKLFSEALDAKAAEVRARIADLKARGKNMIAAQLENQWAPTLDAFDAAKRAAREEGVQQVMRTAARPAELEPSRWPKLERYEQLRETGKDLLAARFYADHRREIDGEAGQRTAARQLAEQIVADGGGEK